MANLKENMSASELKYLLVLQEQLSSGTGILMITTIADKMGVSKASVSNALDRLMVRGYIKRDKKHIGITEKGNEVLNEYNEIIGFISKHALRRSSMRQSGLDRKRYCQSRGRQRTRSYIFF